MRAASPERACARASSAPHSERPEVERFAGHQRHRHRGLHVLHLPHEVRRARRSWCSRAAGRRATGGGAGLPTTRRPSWSFAHRQRRQVGGVDGHDRLLHLEEQRVIVAVAEEQHQIGARADAADADDAVGHVGDPITAQHEPVGRREMLGVLDQRGDDLAARLIVDARQDGRASWNRQPPSWLRCATFGSRDSFVVRFALATVF